MPNQTRYLIPVPLCAAAFLLLSGLMSGGCKTKSSPTSTSSDPFAGISCDVKLSNDTDASTLEGELIDGTSSASPFVVCIAAGVEVNGNNIGTLDISQGNLEFIGADSTSILRAVNVTSTGSSNTLLFKNLSLLSNSPTANNSPLTLTGTASVILLNVASSTSFGTTLYLRNGNLIVTSSTIQNTDNTTGNCAALSASVGATPVLVFDQSSCVSSNKGFTLGESGNLTVSSSSVTSTGDALLLEASSGTSVTEVSNSTLSGIRIAEMVTSGTGNITATMDNITATAADSAFSMSSGPGTTHLTVNNSSITVAAFGFNLTVGGGSVTTTLKDSTFRASGPYNVPLTGISANVTGGTFTLNDTSTGTKNFFCNVSGSTSAFSTILSATGTVVGTFNPLQTANGSNTSIGICP